MAYAGSVIVCVSIRETAGRMASQPTHGGVLPSKTELPVGVKKTGKGRRKIGRKKRRMRARIRHRK